MTTWEHKVMSRHEFASAEALSEFLEAFEREGWEQVSVVSWFNPESILVADVELRRRSADLVKRAVDVLNEALEADRAAVTALVNHHVPANGALADHPTVQVSPYLTVGFLGLLNAVVTEVAGRREDGHGWVAANHLVACPNGCVTKDEFGEKCRRCGARMDVGEVVEFLVLSEPEKELSSWECRPMVDLALMDVERPELRRGDEQKLEDSGECISDEQVECLESIIKVFGVRSLEARLSLFDLLRGRVEQGGDQR